MSLEEDWAKVQGRDLEGLLAEARLVSREHHGPILRCFIPGHMSYMNIQGRYPTVSITGEECQLRCDHCDRQVLKTMYPATGPEDLIAACERMDQEGDLGVLISGGCARDGRIPWDGFIEAIRAVKSTTDLKVSIHTGLIDHGTARRLAKAGVDEFLVDVVGSEETLRTVCHLDVGLTDVENSLAALEATGRPLVPHIVVGLHYGRMLGEIRSLEMVARHRPSVLVIVVLVPLRESPMETVGPPEPELVARFLALSRLALPAVPLALSCARPFGEYRRRLDMLAVEAGVNRIAMPSDEAVSRARDLGLSIEFHRTCCSGIF